MALSWWVGASEGEEPSLPSLEGEWASCWIRLGANWVRGRRGQPGRDPCRRRTERTWTEVDGSAGRMTCSEGAVWLDCAAPMVMMRAL